MWEFIHDQNLAHYRRLLAGEIDDAARAVVQRPLDEEEERTPPEAAGDDD